MTTGLLGLKVGMTQIFDETNGTVVPVTVLQVGPCTVLQLRTLENDGYEAVQLGFQEKKRTRARRSERGHVARLDSKRNQARQAAGVSLPAKADCEPPRYIREFRTDSSKFEVGQKLDLSTFQEVKAVDVTAISKGRGFQGAMKRHNFSGQRATHGVKKVHRHMGGTGQNTTPARVRKGRKMPGQMGNERVTTRNIKVVRVDTENNLLLIYGGVPGPRNGLVMIRPTNKISGQSAESAK